MMQLNLAGPLPDLVRAKFEAAKAAGEVVFSDTEVTVIRTEAGIPVCFA